MSYWFFAGEFKGILSTVMEGVKTGQFSNMDNTFASDKTLGPYGNFTIQPTPASDFEFDPATGTIIRYKGTDSKIVVPFEIDGVEVKIIGSYFNSASYSVFNEITLPNTVTTLESGAFQGSVITNFNMPNSIINIGDYCFADTLYLQSINFSNNLEVVGDYAFMRSDLQIVTFPSSLKTIGSYVFLDASIRKITFENGSNNKSIGEYAFLQTADLVSVTLPNTLIALGENTFQSSGIKALTLPASLEVIPSGLVSGSEIESITIDSGGPNKIIGAGAFEGSSNLKEIQLPNNLKTFGPDAYNNSYVFAGSGLTELNLPGSLKDVTNDNAPGLGGSNISKLIFAEGITSITADFSPVGSSLTELILPNSLVTLGNDSFINSNVEVIQFGSGLKTIGYGTFAYNEYLTSVIIPDSVTSIGLHAFIGCGSLATAELPSDFEGTNWTDIFPDTTIITYR